MRNAPFETMEELTAYVGGESIECLECGKHFQIISGKHLRFSHGMNQDEYRDKWGIPRTLALATPAFRAQKREQLRNQVASGVLTYDHLATASDPKNRAPMTPKTAATRAAHSALVKQLRPGDHSKQAPGAKRSDGRSNDRAREYQQAYRALKSGNPALMQAYRAKYAEVGND